MKGEIWPGADEYVRVFVVVHVHIPRNWNSEAPDLPVRSSPELAPVQNLGQLQFSVARSLDNLLILKFLQEIM